MKTKLFILSSAFLLLTGCTSKEEVDHSRVVPQKEETVISSEKIETVSVKEQTSNDPDEKMLLDIFKKHEFLLVRLENLKLYNDAGNKKDGHKVMNLFLSFNAPNSAENTQLEIDKYTIDLAVAIYNQRPEVSKLNVFWEVPDLKEDWNVVKINFVRDDIKEDMIIKKIYYDASVFP